MIPSFELNIVLLLRSSFKMQVVNGSPDWKDSGRQNLKSFKWLNTGCPILGHWSLCRKGIKVELRGVHTAKGDIDRQIRAYYPISFLNGLSWA